SLIRSHNEAVASGARSGEPVTLEIGVIDKARELGQHGLSGAVLNPVVLAELMPDYLDRGCPVARTIKQDAFYYLTPSGHLQVPPMLIPPENDNRGFHTLSLQRLVKWMAEIAEGMGVYLFPATTGVEVLHEGDQVVGVRTGDKGLEKGGGHKANFEPGIDI